VDLRVTVGTASILASAAKVALISGGVNVDRKSLSETEFKISQPARCWQSDSGTQTGYSQWRRAKLTIVAIGVIDLRKITLCPVHWGHGERLNCILKNRFMAAVASAGFFLLTLGRSPKSRARQLCGKAQFARTYLKIV
jgi:hypothetical protein